MPRTCLMSEWLQVSIYLLLLICSCVISLNSPPKPDTVSPQLSVKNLTTDVSSSHPKYDDLESIKPPKDHSKTIVARKGAFLDDNVDPSPESCDESSGKSKSSSNCSSKNPVSKIITADKNSGNISLNSSGNSGKVTPNRTVISTTAEPVMKPRYTIDNSSDADYDESSGLFSSENGFLTTLSLSLFILVLLVLITVLFFRLKYKFSVEQNYRRVDYLIDGMYID